MWSVTTSPSTASPRNSRRSFDTEPGASATQDRWARARCRSSWSSKRWARRPESAASAGFVSRSGLESGADVVDCVSDGLEILEILVLDPEPDGALADFFLDRLHQLDQGQRVGLEVVAERLALADRVGLDLEDVGQ